MPNEELTKVILTDDPSRFTFVGASTKNEDREQIVSFLRRNADLFAWTSTDMPGIDSSVITHKLAISPAARPIAQKKCNLGTEKCLASMAKAKKLIDANFIREIRFTIWLVKVVMVKKSNGKWRMCVNFTDLYKACPKDTYPLPCIDTLVDNSCGYSTLSFMDAYSGYNQIFMHPSDQDKTAFVTEYGATYQRLMNKIFDRQIGRNIEVYVDDMVAKTKVGKSHIDDLSEIFSQIRQYNMRLNPEKCTFGVRVGKFLGFILTSRGIEANPEKSISSVLIVENNKIQQPVYFISKSLQNAELRYPRLEKLAFALVFSARRLRPYFQSHTINVRTGQPLRQILAKPKLAERLIKWSIKLSEFDVHYQPRRSIKSQYLVDFVTEFTGTTSDTRNPDWVLFVDEASNTQGSGAGILLENEEGIILEHSLRFSFKASNNQAEYEALITGLSFTAAHTHSGHHTHSAHTPSVTHPHLVNGAAPRPARLAIAAVIIADEEDVVVAVQGGRKNRVRAKGGGNLCCVAAMAPLPSNAVKRGERARHREEEATRCLHSHCRWACKSPM
ncbi:uncharacterized protein [Arachis hypogaea]|uniref:uncharacterized protein n=1 Tax=Arachis hypogaea TaxID=3818 RepID=UPI003B216A70